MVKPYWNYRVMRHIEDGEVFYSFHEVHYRNGRVAGWAKKPVTLDYIDDPLWIISKLTRATEEPVLDYHTGKEIKND